MIRKLRATPPIIVAQSTIASFKHSPPPGYVVGPVIKFPHGKKLPRRMRSGSTTVTDVDYARGSITVEATK